MRYQSIQQLALSVRQRLDIGGQGNAYGANGNENPTDLEAQTMISASVGRLWKKMVRKAPENYAWGDGGTGTRAGYIIPAVQGTYRYNLPFDFLKEKGVDLGLDSSGQNWATMRPYTERDRNLFSFPLQTALAYAGWQNMRWQIQGSAINILPQVGPLPAMIRLLYAPAAPILCPSLPTIYAPGTVYAQGALVYVPLSQSVPFGSSIEPPLFHVFYAQTAGTSSASGSAPGQLTLGTGTSAITFTSLLANGPALNILVSNTGGPSAVLQLAASSSVFASVPNQSVTIQINTNGETAQQIATLVNSTAGIGGVIVSAHAAGTGVVANGSGAVSAQWALPGVTTDNGISWAYQAPIWMFANGFDGINGWEELVVLDVAIKTGIKLEFDVSALMTQMAALMADLDEDMADRNQGDPLVLSGGFGMCEGGPAYGNGFGPFGGGFGG